MAHRFLSFSLCLAFCSFLFGCNVQSDVAGRQRVDIAYLPAVHSLPLFIAKEKGYFDDVGIDVNLVKFEAPNQIIDALLSGNVGIGGPGSAAGITAVSQAKRPGTLAIYAVSGASSEDPGTRNEALLVRHDSVITSFADLRRKALGILPGIQWRTIATHLLAKYGLQPGDVTLQELAIPLQAQALASGQVDAVLGLEPVPTIVLEKGIGRSIEDGPTLRAIADPFYPGAGIYSVAYEREHPDVVLKTLTAIDRAIDDIRANPVDARRFLVGYTPLDISLAAKVPLLTWKMRGELTNADVSALQVFFDIFQEHGVIDRRVLVDQVLSPIR